MNCTKYTVIKMHTSEFENPLMLSMGDRLIIGEKSDDYEAWDGWYFCETEKHSKGWVPEQIIKWLGDKEGEALEAYWAKEMNVEKGEVLMGSQILNGWVWCQRPSTKEEGWVPLENLL